MHKYIFMYIIQAFNYSFKNPSFSFNFSLSFSLYIYIYIYIYNERDRDRESGWDGESVCLVMIGNNKES